MLHARQENDDSIAPDTRRSLAYVFAPESACKVMKRYRWNEWTFLKYHPTRHVARPNNLKRANLRRASEESIGSDFRTSSTCQVPLYNRNDLTASRSTKRDSGVPGRSRCAEDRFPDREPRTQPKFLSWGRSARLYRRFAN
jgi:hypothetical protein